MMITPENLIRHELVGLPVKVVESRDPGQAGAEGRVSGDVFRTGGMMPGGTSSGKQKNRLLLNLILLYH